MKKVEMELRILGLETSLKVMSEEIKILREMNTMSHQDAQNTFHSFNGRIDSILLNCNGPPSPNPEPPPRKRDILHSLFKCLSLVSVAAHCFRENN